MPVDQFPAVLSPLEAVGLPGITCLEAPSFITVLVSASSSRMSTLHDSNFPKVLSNSFFGAIFSMASRSTA